MINKLESIWKELLMAQIKVLSKNMPAKSEENYENPH
jgi:hypothetical protein